MPSMFGDQKVKRENQK